MKAKCHSKMPVPSKTRRGELAPECDFSLWFALQGSLEGAQFVSSRIRERFANIQELQSTEIALLRFFPSQIHFPQRQRLSRALKVYEACPISNEGLSAAT